jgi:DNA-binding Lrp family transcriptional regulator
MIPEAPIPILRVALRAANGFALELLRIQRGERDFTDAIILATLVQSNSAPVSGDPELQRRYAAFAAPVPEEMRRAISINAMAASLGLPFETVRRRTKRLIADGLCEATPQGVRLSNALLASDAHARGLQATYAAAQGLYERLLRTDCVRLMDLPPRAPAPSGDTPPVRIVWRASADYFLRMMEILLPAFPSITRAFVVLEVTRANLEDVPDGLRGDESYEPQALLPDEYRKPVRASVVAASLGLPHETVRRTLTTLVEEGRCLRVRGGFVVPAEVLARPRVVMALGANFRNLGRMFAELAETGVLTRWDLERRAAGTAA